ncbi:MAG TPA: AAA family ATPase, partial [Cyclobacteriaceae bacterium]|nr:AAA family ATPase [Cyclobacteriaceae bacterium]
MNSGYLAFPIPSSNLSPILNPTQMIVLTGGAFAGKTTLINKLSELGHPVFPESALITISMFNGLIGRTKQFSWRMTHTSKFQKRVTELDIIKLQIAHDLKLKNVFWDRGLHDGIVY